MKLADQIDALYDAYVPGRKKNPDAAKVEIKKVLKAGKIDFDTLMLRSAALCEMVQKEGIERRHVLYPERWYKKGGYNDDDLMAYCSPEKRLKAMFVMWYKLHKDGLVGIDEYDAEYVWLAARVAKPAISREPELATAANLKCRRMVERYARFQATEEESHERTLAMHNTKWGQASAAKSGYKPPDVCPKHYPPPEVLAIIERLKAAPAQAGS